MELFEAPDLRKILRRRGTLLEAEVVKIGIQVARALQHADENHLVHRDVKPENLLMREDTGLVKLTDLGLARSTSRDEKRLTQDGTTMGTPYYMSPEAVKGCLEIDIRADLYSLGATLYHLATGLVPFEADNVFLVLRKQLEEPLVPPRRVNGDLSEAFDRIVVKLMQKDADARYDAPEDLLEDLETLDRLGPVKASELMAKAPPRTGPPRRRRPAARRKRLAPVLAALAVLAAAGIAAIVALVWTAGGGGEPDPGRGTGLKPGPGGTEAPPPRPDPNPVPPEPAKKPPPDSPPRPSREAEDAFEAAEAFAASNPGRLQEIVSRFEAVGRGHPALREACDRAVEKFRGRAVEADLKALIAEVEDLVAKKKFGPAVNLLHAFPLSHRVPADVEADLKARTERALAQAASEAEVLERKAARAMARRNPQAAVRALEEIRAFEVSVLTLRADQAVRKVREAESRILRVRAHVAVLDEVAASGIHRTADRPPGAAQGLAEEKENLKRAADALDAAARGAEARKGQKAALRLRDGTALAGVWAGAGPSELLLEDARKNLQGVPWPRVSLEAVADLGGSGSSGLPLACLAWYLHRDFDRALEILAAGNPEDAAPKALRALIDGALDVELGEALESARTALESGLREDALRMVRALLVRFRDTAPFAEREGEVRGLVEQAAGPGSAEAAGAFLFRGAVSAERGAWKVEYAFPRPNQLRDFDASGAARFSAREGRLLQEDPNPALAALLFPGAWSALEVSLEAEIPDDGGLGISFGLPQGERFLLLVSRRKGELTAAFSRVPLSGESAPVGKAARGRPPAGVLKIVASAGPDGLKASVEGLEELRAKAAVPLPCRGALEAVGRFSAGRLALRGEPARAWLDEVARWEACRSLILAGEWVDLLRECPLGRWGREGGRSELKDGVLSVDAVTAALRMWIPGAGALVRDGQGTRIAVEVRRLSDAGWFHLGFLLDGRTLGWLFTADREETRPAGAPRDHAILTAVPFTDRQWHTLLLEVKDGQASMFVDGETREVFRAEDLKDLDSGELRPKGLGFGVQGGRWEVRSFKVGRAAK
jgi:serine/threonine-protein kinase